MIAFGPNPCTLPARIADALRGEYPIDIQFGAGRIPAAVGVDAGCVDNWFGCAMGRANDSINTYLFRIDAVDGKAGADFLKKQAGAIAEIIGKGIK